MGILAHDLKLFEHLSFAGAGSSDLPDFVTSRFTPWHHMERMSLQGIVYLANSQMECIIGQVLTRLKFEENSDQFRYAFDCLGSKQRFKEETFVTQWSAYLGWNPEFVNKFGNVNFLDRQVVICPNGAVLTSIKMEVDRTREVLRYVYKCGKFNSGPALACREASTVESQAEEFFLPSLRHHDIKCAPGEGLAKFQLRTKYYPHIFWYNFICCTMPQSGKSIKVFNS